MEKEINTVKISNFIVTPQTYIDENTCESIINKADSKGIKIQLIKSGDSLKFKNGAFKCLYPASDVVNTDTNADSMVLLLEINGVEVLFSGDLPSTVESKLKVPDIDILKVSHHGSKTATSKEFLSKINPKCALISCGIDNSYGHPAPEVLANLSDLDAASFITAESGQIRVIIDNDNFTIKTYLD